MPRQTPRFSVLELTSVLEEKKPLSDRLRVGAHLLSQALSGQVLVFLLDPGSKDLVCAAQAGGGSDLVGERIREGQDLLSELENAHGRWTWEPGAAPVPLKAVLNDWGMREHSGAFVSIRLGERWLGGILVFPDGERPPADQVEVQTAEVVAKILGLLVEHSRLTGQEGLESLGLFHPLEEGEWVIGSSPEMQELFDLARRLAQVNSTVLLMGETGTGKEVLARAVHQWSNRRDGPFIYVNCSAIPETLLESELFGHEKGAFTGAVSRKKGRFELAEGGTLFLDEIGEAPPSIQVKLLNFLDKKVFERVGGIETFSTDVRIIAATNRDLTAALEEGKIRHDLYYRLKVVAIRIPPLRERREEILPLTDHFIRRYNQILGRRVHAISPEVKTILQRYPWPGNVRELKHVIERALILARGDQLELQHLAAELREAVGDVRLAPRAEGAMWTLQEMEEGLVRRALEQHGGNQTRAAKGLGITRNQLRYRMKKYGIDPAKWAGRRGGEANGG